MSKNPVTRRQFLSYTLTGVGGFMAAGMILPMLRFAIDPVLTAEASGDFKMTDKKIADITAEPVRVDFKYEQVDAWHTSETTQMAWVYKNEAGDIVALSPICKHLGCTVNWNGSEKHPDQFFCPCHMGLYTKDGNNVPGTPPRGPLDAYPTKEKDGFLMLGTPEENPFVRKK
ncbi:QcrA and Rieske domain-containing protein [Lederbergia lenta]|uniref:Menaquinol:cytochrome c reductase iron-sulfur subunit n=1 Tax=Lederbergia lenta TaxID=1467 RepID=A0A2X4WG24_LEDLE|nr:ubiquinol-cytochrome c reductase iron-sulfur subunit [Lederbergia lenta]MEC2324954.1 ubiquinol-cytochrome c reductase iron-sulfur subunit [Lederbergia lenta]SQI56550.1 Rieske (2Fe-2S) domain-containing protein [Lederbergia lenta]